ncbi:MAG: cell division protein ZapA [Pseudomonadales bacterium]|nr:cell division protein ZapA [Pseudomonadales bacterium]
MAVQTVTVSILDRQYQVNCKPEEIDALKQSASFLDTKMREIKSAGSVLGLDRIAVMAALNIANDFLDQSRKTDDVVAAQAAEIASLTTKLDQALKRIKRDIVPGS